MDGLYYLCFSVNKLPDLTLTKYSVFDGSSVENIMDKHGVFLRQLHRLGYTSGVYFHLLYYYNPDKNIPKGHHLSIIFYATAQDKSKLDGIREFLTTSVLSNYYEFFCYEIAKNFSLEEEPLSDGSSIPVLKLTNVSGKIKKYSLGKTKPQEITEAKEQVENGKKSHIVCEIASDADVMLSFNKMPVDDAGKIILEKKFSHAAFLTKKDYFLPAQNRLNTDNAGEVMLYSIMEWEPCETGRLYNVLKLMEGYDRSAVLRIDIFPVEHTQAIRQRLPYTETRRRISDRVQGKDDNSENIVKSWDKYLNNLMKFPQFLANVVAFADSQDIAVMLADSVAAEAVESGTYLIETMNSAIGFSMYESDAKILHKEKESGNYVAPFLSLYTLEEIRPMFSFPILYPGEAIECQKETDPIPFDKEVTIDKDTGEMHEVISLGVSSMGYDVTFPVKLFKKHAFIAGVPGAGKTNTMLYLVTTLWRDTKQHVPFLVLEPAKQEYRSLAMIEGMEDLCVFSPGADTKFPLHINPFQFPVGLTLAEHIANLNAVFAGAFELIPPSPFLIDGCIEKVYLEKGWNINERNDGTKEYPTMQELYDSLKVAVEESGYEGETKANIRSVMEVRIGSLLRREIGNVYNVRQSSMEPEDWLERPVIIELESLGEGPANFMSLLISTLIREVLKIRKTSDLVEKTTKDHKREIEHIIFYEEAHNLIGPTTEDPAGGSVDPKISATKYLVKMLAEVRALGEGIVIADQLPTAMAPEVLKNTGLKLGHRITAQDDRNLLGSTMSASADQLEEQGTFGTGQALIFYENLLKPFKMRVAEWEKGVSQTKYDSPTNMQLFEHLKDNERYNHLLSRSAFIMQRKMEVEFDLLRRQAEELKQKINRNYSDVLVLEGNLSTLERKLSRLTAADDISETKKHIADIKRVYEKKKGEFSGAITRDLKKVCWNYANQYYAYMTLSKNYYVHTNDMYMCTINNYLSLFTILKSLHDVPELTEIVITETANVMADISRYVDFMFDGSPAILGYHSAYNNALFDGGNFIINRIDIETERILKLALDVKDLEYDAEKEIAEFASDFSNTYFTFLNVAEKYLKTAELLSAEISTTLSSLAPHTAEWEKAHVRAVQYESGKLQVYMALAEFVVKVCQQISVISGTNRRILLMSLNDMLVSFRTIVDYRDRNATTILSSWTKYPDVWKNTNDVLMMEMNARFAYLHQARRDTVDTLKNLSEVDKIAALSKVARQYNGWFKVYSQAGFESFGLKLSLVNHYIKYLEAMLRLGPTTYGLMIETSSGNWKICSSLMKNLMADERIDEVKKTSWSKLSTTMASIFGTTI